MEEDDGQLNSDDSMIDVFFGALGVASLLFIVLMALPHESTGPAIRGDEAEIELSDSDSPSEKYTMYKIKHVAAGDWPTLRDTMLRKWADDTSGNILLMQSGQTETLLYVGLKDVELPALGLQRLGPEETESDRTFAVFKFDEDPQSESRGKWVEFGKYKPST